MHAVVMAGGRGTRMRPYTTVLPKPLLPVGDRPILAILLEQLAAAGVERIDLCVGYLGELIQAYLTDAPPSLDGVELRIHTETVPLGTAGALSQIGDIDEPFLSLNGDVLTSLDYAALMSEHRLSGATLTIAAQVHETEVPGGVLELKEGEVISYVEKPVLEHVVSRGIYALDPSALEYLPSGRADIPTLARSLIEAGLTVAAYRFDGSWYDIGTLGDHEAATADFERDPGRYIRRSASEPTST